MENTLDGGVNRVAGRVQDTVGAATGDAGLQVEGKVRQAAGKIQQGYGDVLESVRSQAESNPLLAVAIAAGVGFVLGAFWANRD